VELDKADVELKCMELEGLIGGLKTDGRSVYDTGEGSREGERQRFGDDGRVEQFKAAGHGVPSFSNG